MSLLQRASLLRPEDGVSSGDRVSHWLWSTRLWPAVLLGEESDHGDTQGVHLSSLTCNPTFPSQNRRQIIQKYSYKWRNVYHTSVNSLCASMLLQEGQKQLHKLNDFALLLAYLWHNYIPQTQMSPLLTEHLTNAILKLSYNTTLITINKRHTSHVSFTELCKSHFWH